jgi:hypothetical protein
MARNQLPKALEELDRVFATTLFNGPKAAAERVVRDLQQAGPSWTGKFSNSWQIETPTNTVKHAASLAKTKLFFVSQTILHTPQKLRTKYKAPLKDLKMRPSLKPSSV